MRSTLTALLKKKKKVSKPYVKKLCDLGLWVDSLFATVINVIENWNKEQTHSYLKSTASY